MIIKQSIYNFELACEWFKKILAHNIKYIHLYPPIIFKSV